MKDRNTETDCLTYIGLIYRWSGQYAQAIDSHSQSLAIMREIGDRNSEASSLSNLGLALFHDGSISQSLEPLEQAIETLESLRQGLTDDHKVSFFETLVSPYTTLQEVHIAQGDPRAALAVAERWRARARAELLMQRTSFPLAETSPL